MFGLQRLIKRNEPTTPYAFLICSADGREKKAGLGHKTVTVCPAKFIAPAMCATWTELAAADGIGPGAR